MVISSYACQKEDGTEATRQTLIGTWQVTGHFRDGNNVMDPQLEYVVKFEQDSSIFFNYSSPIISLVLAGKYEILAGGDSLRYYDTYNTTGGQKAYVGEALVEVLKLSNDSLLVREIISTYKNPGISCYIKQPDSNTDEQ